MENNQELQTEESKEPQTHHRLNTELQKQNDVSGSQAQKIQELQTQQSQETQTQDEGKQAHQSQELPHHKEQQPHQIPTATQVPASVLSQVEPQKLSTQNRKHQVTDKELQHQQEQHCKKLKKKLVGENQERINFLVQASQALALKTVPSQQTLAAQTGSLATAVGRRCVLRLDSSLKRCLCKGCGTTLVYGLNARVRHRSRRQKHLVVTCLTCHTIKRFVSDPKHKLWYEQEEALVCAK